MALTLTPEQIEKLAVALRPELRRHSEYKYIEKGDQNPYKPSYRAMALLMAPDSLPASVLGMDEFLTLKDTNAVLVLAFPYFAEALERDPETFACNHQFMIDAWEHVR
jgi:hypothetical protein